MTVDTSFIKWDEVNSVIVGINTIVVQHLKFFMVSCNFVWFGWRMLHYFVGDGRYCIRIFSWVIYCISAYIVCALLLYVVEFVRFLQCKQYTFILISFREVCIILYEIICKTQNNYFAESKIIRCRTFFYFCLILFSDSFTYNNNDNHYLCTSISWNLLLCQLCNGNEETYHDLFLQPLPHYSSGSN